MTAELQSTWDRDLSVLRAAARRLEATPGQPFQGSDLGEDLSLDAEDVTRALIALGQGQYLEIKRIGSMQGLSIAMVLSLTERGRRTAGLWPSGEGPDALADALRQAAEETDDEEERSALRRAAGAVLGVSRDIMTDVIASALKHSAGI